LRVFARMLSCWIVASCVAVIACRVQAQSVLTLRGTVLTPETVYEDGFITTKDGRILAAGESSGQALSGSIQTDSIILPGLVDIHNHITWNFLPRWRTNQLFANRYEWQQLPSYKIALDVPHREVFQAKGLPCDADRYGEVKAIVGGATSVVGGLGPVEPDDNRCIIGLARNLDNYSGFGDPGIINHERVRYEVFPLEMKLGDAAQVKADLESGKLKSFLIHLAEGKPSDAATAREFRMLDKRGDGFVRAGVSIIHGVALGKSEFEQMAKAKVGLVWAPRSNIELYGATADVAKAKAAGVKIALAPDWSPSGSDGLLQELQYAATWNAAQNPPVFSNSELLAMVTSVPAELAGVEKAIGHIAPGYYADLLLIRKRNFGAYKTVLRASPADVRLVVINGVGIYGDPDLMNKLSAGRKLESVSVCGQPKLLYMDPQENIPETHKSFKQIGQELESQLAAWGGSLAPLTACNTPVQ